MMTNLFSTFDPVSSVVGLPLNWGSLLVFLLALHTSYWKAESRPAALFSAVGAVLRKEMETHLSHKTKQGSLLLLSVFTVIVFANFMGLFPWLFTGTSHISVTLGMALPCWVAFMLKAVVCNFTSLMSHLVPSGTPSALMPFMVVIESVSLMIRPVTLSVRLGANMVAGHLLLTLIGSSISVLSSLAFLSTSVGLLLLLVLELAVSVIQAYVFMTLLTLYLAEI
uniref:ATP synthase subunit a n=1 Tax=Portunion sp. TaxID=2932407 RepID=A0A977TPZ7_9CRUS|nr:ATP synthase F0 subunit 6 [Portunion sp.]